MHVNHKLKIVGDRPKSLDGELSWQHRQVLCVKFDLLVVQ